MADQREQPLEPIVSGSSPADVTDLYEEDHEESNGQREVDHLFDEDSADEDTTDETEQHDEPLRIDTDTNALQNVSDNASPPGSAFSPDSSDEDDDADDEAEGEDNDTESYEADEWEGFSDSNVPYSPPFVPIPAVWGIPDVDKKEIILYRGPRNNNATLYHSERRLSDPETRRNKIKAHQEAENRIVMPTPLRTTSSPDSPESPKNKQSVLPGPNPEAGDRYVVSPLQEGDLIPRPQSALGHRRSSTWDWSGEDDDEEEDSEWLKNAIKEIKTPRRKSEGSLSENLPSRSTVQVYLAGNAGVPLTPDHDTEPVSDNAGPPDDPVSPISPVDPSDQPDAVNDSTDEPSHDSDLPASLRVGTSESNIGDGAMVSSQADQETHLPTPTAPEGFNPVFDTAYARSQVPISPDPDGPETLTGLTPQEGIDAWWEFHNRTQPRPFRTNRNPDIQDETGDLTPMDDSSDREDAADFLSKQRFLLKQQEPEITVECASEDHKKTQEQLTIQMLKYRYQRNQTWYDLKDSEARVARRDKWITELEQRVAKSDQKIAHLTHDLDLTEHQYFVTKMQTEKLESQLGDCHGHGRELRAQVEDLSERLKESQESCANHDGICAELQAKIDELEEKLVSVENDESHKSTERQLQAEAETLRQQLRKCEDELVACRAHSEQLQSRKDELEVELETLRMTQQANDSSASNLSDRAQAAEELARDRQAIIDDLEARLSSRDSELTNARVASSQANEKYRDLEANKDKVQKDLDGSNTANATLQTDLDAARREVEILREELRLRRETSLEQTKLSSSPSPGPGARPSDECGTQKDTRDPSITPQQSARTRQNLEKLEETFHEEFSQEPPGWAERRRAIMRQPEMIRQLEARRAIREARQAVEREKTERISQRIAATFRMAGVEYDLTRARPSGAAV